MELQLLTHSRSNSQQGQRDRAFSSFSLKRRYVGQCIPYMSRCGQLSCGRSINLVESLLTEMAALRFLLLLAATGGYSGS